jgi:uncharacterized protein (DUF3820 family)
MEMNEGKEDTSPIMPFGKFRGQHMSEIPANYLRWLYEDGIVKAGPLLIYLEKNIAGIRKQIADGNRDV